MKTKQLTQQEIKQITSEVKNWLDMYSPQVNISQTNSEQLVWRVEQNNKIHVQSHIACNISILSTKDPFEKPMFFHPSFTPKSIARKIARDFFDKVDKNTNGPLAKKLWG